MSFHNDLKTALISEFGKKNVVFMQGWTRQRRVPWAKGTPVALLLHHTAGAVTDSVNPKHPGNQTGANAGQVTFIQNHYEVPAANFTLDRDGTLYVHSAYPIWHAGLGSFRGKKPWNTLGVPDDRGNDYMLGVEIVSKGLKKDFLPAQKDGVAKLLKASGKASGWRHPRGWKSLVRRPRHKDWTTRKVDIRYDNAEVGKWLP